MIGQASTRLEFAVAMWLEGQVSVPVYSVTQTDAKSLPCVVVRAGVVSQPAFPDNFFTASLDILLISAAPQTTISTHRSIEDSLHRTLTDYLAARADVDDGVKLSGFRLATIECDYQENRTATTWVVEVDFCLVDS
jgi:hypothetical protein